MCYFVIRLGLFTLQVPFTLNVHLYLRAFVDTFNAFSFSAAAKGCLHNSDNYTRKSFSRTLHKHKIANIANFALAVQLEMNKANEVCNFWNIILLNLLVINFTWTNTLQCKLSSKLYIKLALIPILPIFLWKPRKCGSLTWICSHIFNKKHFFCN